MFWQKYTTPLKGIEIEGVSSMPFEEHTYIRIKIRSKSSTHVSRLLIPGHKIATHPREDFLDSLPIHPALIRSTNGRKTFTFSHV